MIEPIKPLLEKSGVDTLVFVPDGALRSVPIAALYDGKNYVLEQYAVAVAPGLSLIESQEATTPNSRFCSAASRLRATDSRGCRRWWKRRS